MFSATISHRILFPARWEKNKKSPKNLIMWTQDIGFKQQLNMFWKFWAYLEGIQCPLAQVVRVEQLQFVEELNEKVWPGLILGYQSSYFRVNGLPQRFKQWEVTACIWNLKMWHHYRQIFANRHKQQKIPYKKLLTIFTAKDLSCTHL